MSEPFIAEIKIFAGNFAPRNWASCDGALLPISQNTALFSLIGTIYGGDGRTTTGLPDLRGRAPMHPGRGPGLQIPRNLGNSGGTEETTLSLAQIPSHSHALKAVSDIGEDRPAVGRALATSTGGNMYQTIATNLVDMHTNALPSAGSSQGHNNTQPFTVLKFIIALQGIYPTRS